MTDRLEDARQLAWVASDLDRRGYAYAGLVRRAARALLTLGPTAEKNAEDGCEGCGADLSQPATGGRRKWCGERCRRRHRP